MPRVSIIVPVYNTSAYLPQCLDTICEQSLKDIEIIIVNDGSTDNSLEICKDYANKDKRIKIINKANGGLSSAKNEGMKHVTAPYFGFVDSDDYIEPTMFERLYTSAEQEKADLVICGRHVINMAVNPPEEIEKEVQIPTGVFNLPEDKEKIIPHLFRLYYNSWNKLYKREFYHDLFFPLGRRYEDAFVYFTLYFNNPKVAVISEKLYYYRLGRPGSIMTESEIENELNLEHLDVLTKNLTDYEHFIKDTTFPYDELFRRCKQLYINILKNTDINEELAIKKWFCNKLISIDGNRLKFKRRALIWYLKIMPSFYEAYHRK